jgi:hypothetical protein
MSRQNIHGYTMPDALTQLEQEEVAMIKHIETIVDKKARLIEKCRALKTDLAQRFTDAYKIMFYDECMRAYKEDGKRDALKLVEQVIVADSKDIDRLDEMMNAIEEYDANEARENYLLQQMQRDIIKFERERAQ